ncbi:multidrug transporter [Intrasporangium oryzae NRRL B-24470]|uniref:Multidrug transporter n=1 Tax=Intrasporangium oryzae NRRL B-24470 TaxID=1386089 RepID=W9G4J3_9MICO|nr:MFS transporter [Intrasporangium oryzae]EWT00227.1 multidrug transporter [Intrasporangium oryzae NRRL B-24470]
MRSLRDLPTVVWVLAAGRFVSSASSFLMLFLVLYLTGPRGLGVVPAGLVAGANGVGALLGNVTGGRYGDQLGHRRVLLLAASIVGVVTALIPWQPVWLLAIPMPLTGYLGAVASLSRGALSALAVTPGSRRSAVAVSRAASNAGFVIGPPVGALIAARGYDALFVIDGVVTLVLRHVTSRFLPEEAPVRPEPGATHGLWASVRRSPGLLVLLPAVVLVDIVYRQLYSTLPLHLRDAGQPLGLYTVLIAVGSGLILLLEIPVAVWLRQRPAIPIIATGYLLVAVGFTLFGVPWFGVATAAAVAMIVLTAGEILYKTTATAHVLDAAPAHLVGQYQGLYTGAATSGTMLAAPIGGMVYAARPGLLWPLCGVVAGIGAVLALLSARVPAARHQPADRTTRSLPNAPVHH